MEQTPTVFPNGKATVNAGFSDCAGESAGAEEHGYNREKDGWRNLGSPVRKIHTPGSDRGVG